MLCFRKSPAAKNFMDKRGASRFSIGNFLSHSTENYRRRIVSSFNNFGYRKTLDKSGGSIKIFRRKCFVSECRKVSYGKPSVLCFRKFPVAKKFMDKRGGASRFSVENCLSHRAEKLGNGTLLCCVLESFL